MAGKLPEEGLTSGIIPCDINSSSIGLPETWEPAGKVEKLYIYPVKSAKALQVQEAQVGKHGLFFGNNRDRQFMIVNESGRMVTGRRYPSIVLIESFYSDDEILTLKGPGSSGEIRVDVKDMCNSKLSQVKTEVFGKACWGYDLGAPVAEWLSEAVLKKPAGLRLIYHPTPQETQGSSKLSLKQFLGSFFRHAQKSNRELHPEGSRAMLMPFARPDDVPLYADGFGFLLIGDGSIKELNKRLQIEGVDGLEVEERRFRPNIFVSGTKGPFAEDQWLYLKIGDCVFRNAKLCDRCVFTTINPFTGEKDKAGEPLNTLKKFRTSLDPIERKVQGDSPFFGINLGVDVIGGVIQIGDTVYVGHPTKHPKLDRTFNFMYATACILMSAKIIYDYRLT